jgi:hypothetical protein
MKIVSEFISAKTGEVEKCEDGIIVTDNFAAVIDGATDHTGRRYEGMTGGRYAMLACLDAIRTLDTKADAEFAISHLTSTLSEHLPPGLPAHENPTAVAAIYSVARREIWQIGDVGFWYQQIFVQLSCGPNWLTAPTQPNWHSMILDEKPFSAFLSIRICSAITVGPVTGLTRR